MRNIRFSRFKIWTSENKKTWKCNDCQSQKTKATSSHEHANVTVSPQKTNVLTNLNKSLMQETPTDSTNNKDTPTKNICHESQ